MNKISKSLPLISIIIPTYNSETTLPRVLNAIRRQSYPKNKLEVLVIDGGSSDRTVLIANKFRCRVLRNTKVLQMYAMQMGREQARGKYIVHLDSDEVVVNKKSLENKANIFFKNSKVKAVIPSGLLTPINAPSANYFINEFGEPFSYFIYRISINANFFISKMKKIGRTIYEDKDSVILDFSDTKILPPIELAAIGIMIDREYLLKNLSYLTKDPKLVPLSFFRLVKKNVFFGFTKNDPILHYSVAEWSKYLKKIKYRIVNNIFGSEMSRGGFSGRSVYYPLWFRMKKYLFLPYSFSLIFPIFDALLLTLTRRNAAFLVYPLLCLYISYNTLYYLIIKTLGIKLEQKGYGF